MDYSNKLFIHNRIEEHFIDEINHIKNDTQRIEIYRKLLDWYCEARNDNIDFSHRIVQLIIKASQINTIQDK